MTDALEIYLEQLRAIRSSGAAVKETSGYGALANLFNAVGHTLKPKVRCFIHVKNSGAGLPDGGLFTADQLKNTDEDAPLLGIPQPSRGVIEVKATDAEVDDVADTKQVRDYVKHYGQVLVTNYRSFLLLKRGDNGNSVHLESFQLAPDEKSFWQLAAHPHKAANELGERFAEYLKRVMLHAAPLNNPKDVAFFLASYARDARARVEGAGNLPALAAVRTALEEALGMKFEAEKGEHFFRSTLVQTLFYGVFSAWVLWHKEKPQRKNDFDWKSAAWTLHVPMIKALFEQVATPTKLGPLGLVKVLDWTAAALNRVDRAAFFEKFLEMHAVQYFYEPFLEAFDPELRKQLGVWYTPPEIVQYQVARVDAALREELDIPDGLADPSVLVLDPCCGTGAYLVEVLRKIEKTLKEEKGEGDALNAEAIKQAAQDRVFGFEIMPAPFVVAHLQMGLLLQNLGVPLNESKNERAGIFLTNALTGWEPPTEEAKKQFVFPIPEFKHEKEVADGIKQKGKIIVILGNPPYNAYAGVSPQEEEGLIETYKGIYEVQKENDKGEKIFDEDKNPVMESRCRLFESAEKGGWGIKKFNLDDLYTRFFRLAERRIAEKTGKGIICYISNYSYLSDPSFVVMRERFLQEFDSLWFDCLNGDSRETGKLTPEGKPDPSIFSTEYNREGIRVGTAIGLLVRKPKRSKKSQVLFRQFWGTNKREEILESLNAKQFAKQYEKVDPERSNRFTFCPQTVAGNYLSWPKLSELCGNQSLQGMDEDRANSLIEIERDKLASRMEKYFDQQVEWNEFVVLKTGLSRKSAAFEPEKVRETAQEEDEFATKNLRRYLFRPYDVRWCYYTPVPNVWKRSRPELWKQSWEGNAFLLSRSAGVAAPEGTPFIFTKNLLARDCMRGHAVAFPLRLQVSPNEKPKQGDGNGELGNILHEAAPTYNIGKITANLSPAARAYLAKLGITNPDDDADTAALIWMHALAIGYSPAYLAENADGVRQDWPRIPLPDSHAALLASAELGKQVAALLDTETPVKNVTAGKVRPELVKIAVVTRLNEKLNLSLTAGWGHAGQNGVTMPGKGKLETRIFTEEELAALAGGASVLASRFPQASTARQEPRPTGTDLLGTATHDVFLNESACWQNVPEKVWDYTIGGYQVIKKWLSYREFDLLGRALTPDEAREVTHMARRIAALILLQPELDKNYQAVKAATVVWKP
jgi:hypothetical protein